MNIFIGNLSYEVSEDQLKQMFENFGNVDNVKIIKDRFSNKSKGFAFIEMPEQDQAERAISSLNGREVDGRAITVNEARPQNVGGESEGRGGQPGGPISRSSGRRGTHGEKRSGQMNRDQM